MDAYEPFLSLGLATAAGLLIGLEREQSAPADRAAESFLGGARTHPLVALAGGLSALLARQLGPWVVVAAFAAMVVFLVVNYADDVRRGAERGLTSESAFLVSFLLGALALSEGLFDSAARKVMAVAATAVVVTLLLSAKPVLQPVMRRVSRQDVYSTLKFLIYSTLKFLIAAVVVVLPLLPDRTFGPFDVLNPRQIGWMMTFITLRTLWLPLAAMAAVGFGWSTWLARRRGAEPPRQGVALENPVELRSALGFALLFAAVLLGSKALSTWMGPGAPTRWRWP